MEEKLGAWPEINGESDIRETFNTTNSDNSYHMFCVCAV